MTNKKILLGIPVIALVLGMTVVGCGGPADEDGNPFVGEFTGTFTQSGGQPVDATITFTDTDWALTAGTISLKGTYTRGALQSATLSEGSYEIATCLLAIDSLIVTFSNGTYRDSSGNFTRVKEPPSDPLVGTWSGTLATSGATGSAATITFTDTAWTLTVGSATPETGTYTKSNLGYTVTLTQGAYDVGNCILNPVSKELTVTITNGTYKNNSGKFTRAQ